MKNMNTCDVIHIGICVYIGIGETHRHASLSILSRLDKLKWKNNIYLIHIC